jgi:hypothetical protein
MPRPMKCHALRIDLHEPSLEVVVETQRNSSGEFLATWPTSFVRSDRLFAAINATPFLPARYLPGRTVQLQGIVATDGEFISIPVSNLDALVQSTQGTWSFEFGQKSSPGVRNAVGGFVVNLVRGDNRGERQQPDATTVVGLSSDRRWMYWLVIDGGQPGYSEGANARETAEFMRELGAADAMSMDGGSSSALAMAGGWRGAHLVNRPRSPLISGFQRPVACVLGVRYREETPETAR